MLDIAAMATTALASTACGSQASGAPATDSGTADVTNTGDSSTPQDGGSDAVSDSGETDAVVLIEAGDASDAAPCFSASGNVTADQACALMAQDTPFSSTPSTNVVFGAACESYCNGICPGATGGDATYWRCAVAQGYVDAYDAAQPDGGKADGGAGDAGAVCPVWSSQVVIQCGPPPVGRRTEGAAGLSWCRSATVGAELAGRATLEAVAVHAFETLERELTAHGAPAALLRDVRRARRDEVRHTAMMTRLARRFGAAPRTFEAPAATPVRGLAAIAIENAVEGCVRETYGAVVGLVEARMSSDAQVRRAMKSIAEDECRHAELSWAVAAWIAPRLTERERAAVAQAAREAVETLSREGDPRLVGPLAARVWTGGTLMAA